MNVHEQFLSKVHLFKFFLIAFIVIISGNVGVYGWLFHLGRACAVISIITIYGLCIESITFIVSILTFIACHWLKYFNTTLIFITITIGGKLLQLLSLFYFPQPHQCRVPLMTRFLTGFLCVTSVLCLFLCFWLVRRIKKVNRQMKVQQFITNKSFFSD